MVATLLASGAVGQTLIIRVPVQGGQPPAADAGPPPSAAFDLGSASLAVADITDGSQPGAVPGACTILTLTNIGDADGAVPALTLGGAAGDLFASCSPASPGPCLEGANLASGASCDFGVRLALCVDGNHSASASAGSASRTMNASATNCEGFETGTSLASTGAVDWEAFSVDGTPWLVVANQPVSNSLLYRWNNTNQAFEQADQIATDNAYDWEAFEVDGTPWLAVAEAGTTGSSALYRWDEGLGSFVEAQQIATSNARGWEAFRIGDTPWLAVANHTEGGSDYTLDSILYRWDGSSFVQAQAIETHGAYDWESFTLDGTPWLAVANAREVNDHSIDSVLYRWNAGTQSFEVAQAIPTLSARDIESFSAGGETCLAFANHSDGSSYSVESQIWCHDGSAFTLRQSIATLGASDWEAFTLGGALHLAVANTRNGGDYTVNSYLYRFDGSQFVQEGDAFATEGARGWRFFRVGGDPYLIVAPWYDGSGPPTQSPLYRLGDGS